MSHLQLSRHGLRRRTIVRSFILGLLIILPVGIATVPGCASGEEEQPQQQQRQQQQTFRLPDEAAQALVSALRADDDDALNRIFGPEARDLVSSGDEVMDRSRREKFLQAYDEKHQLQPAEDGSTTLLVVGPNDWPLPIPLVQETGTGRWRFDTEAGQEEIINRRIGQNELDVIEVCQAIVDAQREYAMRDPDGDGVPEYAQRFMSAPGTHNGLYWQTAPGESPSPLGPLVADAVKEGYAPSPASGGEPRPYHGYYFRLLTSQSASAPGGAVDYLINGRMIGGFAAVAYPADYGNSGIMTFLVNHRGDVYQKDLGPDTTQIATAMEAFDPGPDWQIAESASTPTTTPAEGIP